MKRITILPLILIIFLFVSCSEDWLQPDPLSFYTPENVFVDPAGYEAALVRCKKEMNSENHGAYCPIVAETDYTDLAVALRQSDFTKVTPSTSYQLPILTFFTNAYGYIKNANTIISRIDDIEWTDQTLRDRILAEALWFRSYWYFRLVNTYGDVPWEGKELRGPKLDYYSTSRWAILGKIQEDLEWAVGKLPADPAKLGDVSKGAANHLLAKVYLANCDFDKAIAAASAVIDGPYALMTERFGTSPWTTYLGNKSSIEHNVMWDLHRIENKNDPSNTETIYATVDRADAPSETWWDAVGTRALRHFTPSYWKILDKNGQRASNWTFTGGDTLGIGNGDVRTNDFWHYWIWEDENYTWQTTPDMRRADCNWIDMDDQTAEIITWNPASPNYGEPLNKIYYKSLDDTIDTWYSWAHNKVFVQTTNYHQPHGGQGDWYIFRLAETYLIRAEAYWFKGQTGPAAADINMVRGRANAPLIDASEVTLDYIFDERARELYAEEMRHMEMVRVSFQLAKVNKDGYSLDNISNKNWFHDRVIRVNHFYHPPKYFFWGVEATIYPEHMLWPVPQSVITANTLGRINQNVGYDGAELNEPVLQTIPEDEEE